MSMKVPERRLPLHLAAFLGCSTGAYALSLAGITAVQSATDEALAQERAPLSRSLGIIAADHTILEWTISDLADQYDQLAAAYAGIGTTFGRVESGLDRVSGMADAITKSAASVPTRVSLPPMRAATRRAAPPPATHATTGASGG
jgi:hypothetical protein